MVIVHHEGRKAEVPLGGPRQILDPRVAREKRSAACSSVSDVKAMSPTYVRFANPYKVAGLSTRMRFRVASSHMC
jgi:hypothetical protein